MPPRTLGGVLTTVSMQKRVNVIRLVVTPTRQSLASSRKRTLRRRLVMAARSVWSGSRSRVIESRNAKPCWGLPGRDVGGSTEPAAVRRPSQARRPWWVRPDRDLRAGQMLVWITWEHGRSVCFLQPETGMGKPVDQGPGLPRGLSRQATKPNPLKVSPTSYCEGGETSRGSLSVLIVPIESGETPPRRSL